ncbi:MAG: valine--tRNA ligase [Phycisphaeraceae bacterium]|nr:valine--tRNA ligase [Phycisphaeraceae bacterium]
MTTDATQPATELAPMYDPTQVEPAILERYLEIKAYAASPDADGEPYSIVIPPPNVTAALHLGHALNNTLQDVLTRVHRMRGFNTLWMPGSDHAGIATQTVVDKRLQQEGKPALKEYKQQELEGKDGRGAFIEKVTAWKDEYEQTITNQLKEMGCSCDWDRQRFTMDDQCAKAVREAFFRLFKDGLIYRGKRLVNWDPVSQTALADDEVEMQDIDGNFYYMKYPVCDADGNETGDFATVATTRPETMLGDTAVAVNPEDAPRAKYIGKHVKLPIVDRIIPIVGDDYVVIPDPDSDDSKARMASGFLKVTPAHDPNDYEIGTRHDLAIINVMAPDASISIDHGWPAGENPGENAELAAIVGLSREEARKQIVKWFKANDLMGEVKPYRHAVGHSYRSHVPIEPYYTDQWYVKVTDDRLKGEALRAMSESQRQASEDSSFNAKTPSRQDAKGGSGDSGLEFTPDRYAKTFQNWHENIRDWCISRQLWWGHRIPVWTLPEETEIPLGKTLGDRIETLAQWVESDRIFVLFGTRPLEVGSDAWSIVFGIEDDTDVEPITICVRDPEDEDEDIAELLEAVGFEQDPDVLDTWFSSALWPLSTMGWPSDTPELAKWNPTSVLCTAREIITLWVSRMVMFNRYFKGGDLPFKDVFIHAMIQDGHGQKMSKSLGNGVDPMDIIHSHGADAMRYTLTKMTTQTQDVRLTVDMVDPHTGETFTPEYVTASGGVKVAAPIQERNGKKMVSSYGIASGKEKATDDAPAARNTSEKFDEGQKFANKLWNAFRFAFASLGGLGEAGADFKLDKSNATLADRWILHRLGKTIIAVDKAIDSYAFSEYATAVYDFVWRDLCDWYIEIVKRSLSETPSQQRVLVTCLDVSLRLLHPVMPFITERLWAALNERVPSRWRGVPGLALEPDDMLISAAWPKAGLALMDPSAEEDFEKLRSIVDAVRNARNAYKIPPKQEVEATTTAPGPVSQLIFETRYLTGPLTNCVGRGVGPHIDRPAGSAAVLVGDVTVYLHDVIDAETERARLEKLLAEKHRQVKTFEGRLSNKKYVDNAPAHLVQETRDQHAAAVKELEQVHQQIKDLSI